MNIKNYFNSIDLLEIESFVENKITEDLYIEFKTSNFPVKSEFDNKNFSKCISGFANSSGGIIIWGIKASKNKDGIDAASNIKPIKGVIKFENHLKRIEGKSVIPMIPGIEYRRILKNDDEGFLLVYVPPSDRTPHMALYAGKHYYKRSGDSFYVCEHFDIMDMINRKRTPKLYVDLESEIIWKKVQNNKEKIRYHGFITIKNIGNVTAKNLFILVKVQSPFHIASYGIDGNGNRGMKMLRSNAGFNRYIGGSEIVIHPDFSYEVDKIVINEIGFDNETADLIMEFKLYADNMTPITGKIIRTKDEILKTPCA